MEATERISRQMESGETPFPDRLLAVVIEAHSESPAGNCLECRAQWPCDAAIVAAVLKRERAQPSTARRDEERQGGRR